MRFHSNISFITIKWSHIKKVIGQKNTGLFFAPFLELKDQFGTGGSL